MGKDKKAIAKKFKRNFKKAGGGKNVKHSHKKGAFMSDQRLLTSNSNALFPARKFCILDYNTTGNLLCDNATSKLLSGHSTKYLLAGTSSTNSITVPDISVTPYTAATNGPWGVATLGAIYNYFIVNSIEVDLECFYPATFSGEIIAGGTTSSQATIASPSWIAVVLENASLIDTDNLYGDSIDTLRVATHSIVKDITPSGSQRMHVHFRIKPYQILGITKLQYYADPTNAIKIGTSGGEAGTSRDQVWMRISTGAYNANTASNITYKLKMRYHGQAFDKVVTLA